MSYNNSLDVESSKSQMLCLKKHGAKKCGLKNPTNDVWNYCIQNNDPKYCGKKLY